MTGLVAKVSRRTIITAAGSLGVTSVLGAEASVMARASPDGATTRIRRISVVAPDVPAVADELQHFTKSTSQRMPSHIAQAGVHTECFWIGETLIEISEPAPDVTDHGRHIVGLEMLHLNRLRDRSHAAGLRLVRDMTLRGHRLVQPDVGLSGVSLEASSYLEPPPLCDDAISVARLKIAADQPRLDVRKVAILFEGRGSGQAVSFGARSLEFVAPKASEPHKGLVEVTMIAPRFAPQSARIAGIDWRIVA